MEVGERVGHEAAGLRRRQCHLVLLPLCLHGIVSGHGVTRTEARDEVVVAVRAVSEHLHVRHYCNAKRSTRCSLSLSHSHSLLLKPLLTLSNVLELLVYSSTLMSCDV